MVYVVYKFFKKYKLFILGLVFVIVGLVFLFFEKVIVLKDNSVNVFEIGKCYEL